MVEIAVAITVDSKPVMVDEADAELGAAVGNALPETERETELGAP